MLAASFAAAALWVAVPLTASAQSNSQQTTTQEFGRRFRHVGNNDDNEKCQGNSGKYQDEDCPPKKCGDDDKGKGKEKCKKHKSGDDNRWD
jgi:hypothetical protein